MKIMRFCIFHIMFIMMVHFFQQVLIQIMIKLVKEKEKDLT